MTTVTTTKIFSGIQPSGTLHLGNYLGAVRNWVALQQPSATTIYCLVDYHAATIAQPRLRENTLAAAAALLACGIDPERSILFVQSDNPDHAELSWLLSCVARIGWLNRMTQFKEKAGSDRETASLGLYAYPILMAADILLYGTTHVPAGEDQKQHLELTRDIAHKFNKDFGEVFVVPEPMILPIGARVMSLRDGSVKMSKSESSAMGRIDLTDSAEAIALKIRKARTDSAPLPSDLATLAARPEAYNLLSIYAALRGIDRERGLAEQRGRNFSVFKKDLIEVVVEHIVPLGREIARLRKEGGELQRVLRQGAEQARAKSRGFLSQARERMGFLHS